MKKLALYETGQGRWPQLIILANQLRQEEEAKQRERAKLAQARADAVAAKRAYEAPAKAAAKAAKKAVKNALILSGRRKQPGAAAGQGGGAAAGSGGRQLQQPGAAAGQQGGGAAAGSGGRQQQQPGAAAGQQGGGTAAGSGGRQQQQPGAVAGQQGGGAAAGSGGRRQGKATGGCPGQGAPTTRPAVEEDPVDRTVPAGEFPPGLPFLCSLAQITEGTDRAERLAKEGLLPAELIYMQLEDVFLHPKWLKMHDKIIIMGPVLKYLLQGYFGEQERKRLFE